MKNRLHLTILIFLSPLLVAASCNLGTFVAKNTIGRIFSAEDYERGVEDIVVHRLLITPLATLTPTPTPGDQAESGESAGQAGRENEPEASGESGGGEGGGSSPNDDVPSTRTPTPTGTVSPSVTASATGTASPSATASATGTASPSVTVSPSATASATGTASPTLSPPTATSTIPSTDEPANPAQPSATPTNTPTPTATATSTFTPTPTSLPALSSSLKLSDPTGEIFPNGPGGDTPITYTIRVANSSAVTAANVTVRDSLSATFTLDNTSIYGPSPTVSGNTIVWGPFDVLPNTNKEMGFKGAWPYAPPTGIRGQLQINTAEISATWLAAPILRPASVFILYPPQIYVIAATLTPTIVLQTDSPTFTVEVANDGSADTTISTASQLALVDTGNTTRFTTNLSAATAVPADGQPYTLTFSPASLAAVTPSTYRVVISLSWLDENGVTDGGIFTDTGTVGVLAPPAITAAATPDTSTALAAGSNFPARFWLWNTGDVPANFYPGVDTVEIIGSTDWVNFFAAGSYNASCGDTGLWQGSNASTPSNMIVRFTISATTCGDPYQWQPDPTASATYAYFDIGSNAPVNPGTYTITVRTTFNNGTTVNQVDFPYVIP